MKDCPKADVLTQHDLDPEGGIEDAMRTIRGAPFAIDDQAAVAVDSRGKGIDIFAGSQVKQRHPDITKWTRSIHQLTLWIGSARTGAPSIQRAKARRFDANAWWEVRSGGGGGVQQER